MNCESTSNDTDVFCLSSPLEDDYIPYIYIQNDTDISGKTCYLNTTCAIVKHKPAFVSTYFKVNAQEKKNVALNLLL